MTFVRSQLRRAITKFLSTTLVAIVLLQITASARAWDTITLSGAGASFPAPLYLRWFRDFHRAHPAIRPDYQAIGSGAGVANFISGRLDLAGSDIRLTPEQMAQAGRDLVQIPMTAGAVVIAYNLPGITRLRLSRKALSGIFDGRIERWNDAAIAAANPDLNLPDEPITVVARSDASGTTYVMTRHLSALDHRFAESVGVTMTPVWPPAIQNRGGLIRGRGNDGVAAFVKAIPGAIGYVQYSYAMLAEERIATLENRAGSYVAPGREGFGATFADIIAATEEQLPGELADPSGKDVYPIISLSWLITRNHTADPGKREALQELLRYCLTEGQAKSGQLGYIPASEHDQRLLIERLDNAFPD